jgi:hypothetical protein
MNIKLDNVKVVNEDKFPHMVRHASPAFVIALGHINLYLFCVLNVPLACWLVLRRCLCHGAAGCCSAASLIVSQANKTRKLFSARGAAPCIRSPIWNSHARLDTGLN